MPTYVRVRSIDTLRERIEQTGETHVDVATRAGISGVRLSQILSGRSPSLPLEHAAKLEDTLHVTRGTLFVLNDPVAIDLIGPYLDEAGTVV